MSEAKAAAVRPRLWKIFRDAFKWRRPPDRTGTDTGALPRINRRKPWTTHTE